MARVRSIRFGPCFRCFVYNFDLIKINRVGYWEWDNAIAAGNLDWMMGVVWCVIEYVFVDR